MAETWRDDGDGNPTMAPDGGPAAPTEAPADADYVLGEVLGEGGMGRVHRAHDPHLRREVAVKILKHASAVAIDRFLAEAQVTAQLQHPAIPPVHALGRLADGRPYLAMQEVRGESLDVWARRRPSMEERVDVVRRVCDAMAFAHDRGVIHRDLKPENVMVGAFGEVLVMDWGLARPIGAGGAEAVDVERFDRSAFRTLDGNVAGTPIYMAPEQAEGRLEALDARTDVYALGALLYELVAGVPPFDGEPGDVLAAVRAGRLAGPRVRNAAVPRELDAVVRKAMALRPADRYPSALALRADLDAWIGRRPLVYVRSSLGERLSKWAARHRGAVRSTVGVGVVAGLALLVGAWRYSVDVGVARDAAVTEASRARAAERDTRAALGRAQLALADALSAQARFGEARAALDAALALEPEGPDARSVTLARAVLAADSPDPISTCRPHGEGRLRSLAVAPDASRAASWGEDGRVVVWDPLGCGVVAESPVRGPVKGANDSEPAGSPGTYVPGTAGPAAFAWDDGEVRTAVVADEHLHVGRVGERLRAVPLPEPIIAIGLDADGRGWVVGRSGQGFAFDGDGTFVAAGGPQADGGLWVPDGALRVGNSLRTGGELGGAWDARTLAPRWTAPTVSWADADSAGTRLLVGDARGVRLVALGDGAEAWRVEAGAVARVGIDPGDTHAWAAGYDGTVTVFDLADGSVSARFSASERAALAAVAVSTGARVVSVARDSEVFTWLRPARPTRHLLPRLGTGGQGLAVSPDGATVAAGDDGGRVILARVDGEGVADWALGAAVRDLAFAPEGGRLAALTRDGAVTILEPGTAVIRHLPSRRATALTWQPSGLWLGGRDGNVGRLDPGTGAEGAPVPTVPGAIWHLQPLPDGRLLVGSHGAPDNPVRLFDPATNAVTDTLPGKQSRYRSAVSPDGALAAIGQQDGRVPIWEIATGTVRTTLHADDGPTLGVAFAPDGRTLATTGFGGRVMLWDVATGTLLRSIDQHGALGTNVRYTPDGSTLLSVADEPRIGALRLDRPEREAAARVALAAGDRSPAVFAALGWWERAGR